jgi:hypothetical protein
MMVFFILMMFMVLCLPIAIGMADRQRSAIRLPADKSGRDLQKRLSVMMVFFILMMFMVLCLPIAIGMADRQKSAIRLPADKSGRDLQKKTISDGSLFYLYDAEVAKRSFPYLLFNRSTVVFKFWEEAVIVISPASFVVCTITCANPLNNFRFQGWAAVKIWITPGSVFT